MISKRLELGQLDDGLSLLRKGSMDVLRPVVTID
jgi:hypothetical protein